ncbi:MAG: hypothetical protein WCP39_08235, partial [Chlamydiota bacterium]
MLNKIFLPLICFSFSIFCSENASTDTSESTLDSLPKKDLVSPKSEISSQETKQYFYNEQNQLQKIIFPNQKTALFLYNDAKELSNIVYPDGSVVSYNYAEDQKTLKSLTDPLGTTTFEYTSDNQVAKIDRPNGVSTEIFYDSKCRIVSILHTKKQEELVAAFYYQYNNEGLLTQQIQATPSKELSIA